ncbi:hypothetical protein ACJEDY_15645, partial [Escherichia coli]|uniref:hypothetical protein n=1 Tax=Escherichia coli TaxID=562 RepID=UPI003872237B
SLKTSIKTITYLSDIGCLEIQGASLRSAFVIPPQGRNKLIHQLSMHRKHIMFRANDYAVLQTNGSIILSPKSECGHI